MVCCVASFPGNHPAYRARLHWKQLTLLWSCSHMGLHPYADIVNIVEVSISQWLCSFVDEFCISCMKNIGVWQKENNMDDPILYVFETSQHDKILRRVFDGLDERQIEYYRVSGIEFNGKELSPLQAADILAYENTVEMYRRVDPGRKRPIRESIKNLARPESDWAYYEESHIIPVLENAERLGRVKVVAEEN